MFCQMPKILHANIVDVGDSVQSGQIGGTYSNRTECAINLLDLYKYIYGYYIYLTFYQLQYVI